MVEAIGSFIAYPTSAKRMYKPVFVLRSLILVDSTIREVSTTHRRLAGKLMKRAKRSQVKRLRSRSPDVVVKRPKLKKARLPTADTIVRSLIRYDLPPGRSAGTETERMEIEK